MSQSQVNNNHRTSLSIFAGDVNLYHKLSLGLSLVIWMAVIYFLVDLVRMIGCFNFYSLFVDTLVLSIFLLNYFESLHSLGFYESLTCGSDLSSLAGNEGRRKNGLI